MQTEEQALHVYQELAEQYNLQNQPRMRDQFLLLAAETAWKVGRGADAERLRLRLLYFNPHHFLKPYSSYDDARQSPDVLGCVEELEETYPLATAKKILDQFWEIPSLQPQTLDQIPDHDVVALGQLPPADPDVPMTADLMNVEEAVPADVLRVYKEREEPKRKAKTKSRSTGSEEKQGPTKLNRDGSNRRRSAHEVPVAPPVSSGPPKTPDIPPTMALEEAPRPKQAPVKQAPRPRPRASPQLPTEEPPQPGATGTFFSILLCVVMAVSAVAVLGYVLFAPFLVELLPF